MAYEPFDPAAHASIFSAPGTHAIRAEVMQLSITHKLGHSKSQLDIGEAG